MKRKIPYSPYISIASTEHFQRVYLVVIALHSLEVNKLVISMKGRIPYSPCI